MCDPKVLFFPQLTLINMLRVEQRNNAFFSIFCHFILLLVNGCFVLKGVNEGF